MSVVRTAVIGLGDFGSLHLDVLSNLPGVEVVALVSRSQERARELAERYGVPHTFQDADEMLARVPVDSVHVVTEETRHLAPVLAALRAGVDVFLEKPMSHDLAEARLMAAEAERLGRKLMVGHILRFDARCAEVKARIASGEMGRVATVYGRRNMAKSTAGQYSHSSRLYTTGIHDVDLVLWYFEGRRPVEVYMKTMDVFGQGDDVFWGIITMDDGSLGVIETSWVLPDATPWQRHILLEVLGTQGAALVEAPAHGLTLWTDEAVVGVDTGYWPRVHGRTVGALRDEILYFVTCVQQNRPIEMPRPAEAVAALTVAQALVRSAQEGRPIRLD